MLILRRKKTRGSNSKLTFQIIDGFKGHMISTGRVDRTQESVAILRMGQQHFDRFHFLLMLRSGQA